VEAVEPNFFDWLFENGSEGFLIELELVMVASAESLFFLKKIAFIVQKDIAFRLFNQKVDNPLDEDGLFDVLPFLK